MAEPIPDAPRYSAFLSYSHRDSAAAGRLHRRLESYRLPRRLIGAETPRGPVPARLWPIFRDRDELPAATDLSETVRAALAESGALIILCSPHAAGSLWVAEEIDTFRRLHPDRPILAAILDGDPPDCFPAALRAVGRDGAWHEPLATDLRRDGDGLRLGLLKLVAGITGVGLDALVQRDAARRIRRVMAVTAGLAVALLAMVALTVFALNARREAEHMRAVAERQRVAAEGQIEFIVTDLRRMLRGVGNLQISTAVNHSALRYYKLQGDLSALSPDSLDRRARVLHNIVQDHLSRDEFPAALSALAEAERTTAEQLARDPGNPDRLFAHMQSEYWIGYVSYLRDQFVSALAAWSRYAILSERLLALRPVELRSLHENAYARGNLCTIAVDTHARPQLAVDLCQRALRRMEAVQRTASADRGLILDVANRHAWLAGAWFMAGRWDLVLRHRKEEHDRAVLLLGLDRDNRDYQDFWMRAQLSFGELLVRHGKREAARPWFERAKRWVELLRPADRTNAEWRRLEVRIQDGLEGRYRE